MSSPDVERPIPERRAPIPFPNCGACGHGWHGLPCTGYECVCQQAPPDDD